MYVVPSLQMSGQQQYLEDNSLICVKLSFTRAGISKFLVSGTYYALKND